MRVIQALKLWPWRLLGPWLLIIVGALVAGYWSLDRQLWVGVLLATLGGYWLGRR